MSLLQAENVVKQFAGHTALSGVSVTFPENCIYGLLGPNGAGKTTLIRIITQITAPDSGSITFNGNPLKTSHVHDMGYLPEERGLYKKMTVGDQAMYLAQLKGMSATQAKKELKMWFEKFEIGAWWNKKVEELSKGMAQKVQFITTVLHKPKLIILDEPFSGFDPINANLIKDEILQLKKDGADRSIASSIGASDARAHTPARACACLMCNRLLASLEGIYLTSCALRGGVGGCG